MQSHIAIISALKHHIWTKRAVYFFSLGKAFLIYRIIIIEIRILSSEDEMVRIEGHVFRIETLNPTGISVPATQPQRVILVANQYITT